jgi:bile acid-coenzyme A ligase
VCAARFGQPLSPSLLLKRFSRVHAVVQPIDPAVPSSADDVIAYAKSRLAAYKVPKTVEFVEEIPRSAATKVNRRALVDARGG